MKDIDFDELDKAVSSLMSTTRSSTSGVDPEQPASPASSQPTAASDVEVQPAAANPVQRPAQEAPTEIPVRTTERSAAPAARRGGRFMDMVHLSSDMKPREPAAPAQSREGISVTPPSLQSETSPQPDTSNLVATPEAEPATSSPEVEVPAETLQSLQSIESEPSRGDADELALSIQNESPFLTDTKVEKRPLNAGSSTESAATPENTEVDSFRYDPIESTESEPAPAAISLSNKDDEPPILPQIPELSSDLVAIESNESVEVEQKTQSVTVRTSPAVAAVPLGSASIPQQYTKQASTGDTSHAAIYDTSQFPQSISHPAKHKSGWLWVLWVVLLLGVGSGGALLLYYFGLIP